jgi:hypothetical protein
MRSIARRIARLEAALGVGCAPQDPVGWRPYRPGGKSRAAVIRPLELRFGNLIRLPPGYLGERHIEVTKQLPDVNGQRWVEFTEVPGPGPTPSQKTGDSEYIKIINIVFVEPYPHPEGPFDQNG